VADIPVKPRRAGTPWWLWLVALLVLAVLVWFALDLLGDDEAEVDDPEAVDVGAPALPDAAPLALTHFTVAR
jgi:hypothetical protein